MERERRFGTRETVLIRARVRTPAGRSIDVVVQDLSERGCRIEKPEYEMIPQRFTLRFPDGRPEMQADIVWQIDNSIGAKFVVDAVEPAPVPRPRPDVQRLSLTDLRRLAGRGG